MAKKTTIVKPASNINVAFLAAIAAGTVQYVSRAEGEPLLTYIPPLIVVNFEMQDPTDPAKVAVQVTDDGRKFLAEMNGKANQVNNPTSNAPTSNHAPFAILNGVVLPPSKRGNTGGGAPVKYPFADLEIGQGFFIEATEKHPDPVKTLGSAVSAANMKYATDTGAKKTVERAKRDGRKAALDASGNKIMETIEVPVYKFERKFVIRGFKAGETYGTYTAPADGAFIARVAVE